LIDFANPEGKFIMAFTIGLVDAALYVSIVVVLIRKYRRTRDSGLLWLLVPMALIPSTALPITLWRHAAADRLVHGQPADLFPFAWVEQGRLSLGSLLTLLNYADHVVWGAFALIAVLALNRQK
jgi:hypothetical protein